MLSRNAQGQWSDGSGYIAAVMLRKSGSLGDGRHYYAFVVNPYEASRVIEWSDGEAVQLEPGAFAHLVATGAARAVTDDDLAAPSGAHSDAPSMSSDEAEEVPAKRAEKPRRGRPLKTQAGD